MRKGIIIFLLLSIITFGESLDSMKKKVKDIDRGIEKSTERISNIEEEKGNVKERIANLEAEIIKIESEMNDLNGKISSISKKIDYSVKSLKFSSQIEGSKLREYNAKLVAWKKSQTKEHDEMQNSLNKKRFKELLYKDLERMEEIRAVQKDLDIVRLDIEKDKRELSSLKYKLVSKERQNQANTKEMDNLIGQLTAEQKQHTKNISNLKSEKQRVQNEIERIIKAAARTVKNVSLTTAKQNIGTLRKPVNGSYTSTFGKIKKGGVRTTGLEIRGGLGRIVRAATHGKVIFAGEFQGLGQVVMIDYGYNMIGIYGNLISVKVKVGAEVDKAQQVGILGLSSEGTPDLYYELRFKLKPINPVSLF